jgi:8-oxo-dGTP pyrophosphatase MutT (NUDIX family)
MDDHLMTQMPNTHTKRAAGCVVYRRDEAGALLVLLIHDKYGMWTLPKGHLEDGESEEQAALREVFEETNITGRLGPLVGRIEYVVRTKKGELRLKQVAFFLLHADGALASPQIDEGIRAAEWHAPAAALGLVGYPQAREVLSRAIEMLR